MAEARKAIETSKQELEKALFARNAFLTVCGHELKTPLTTLKFQSQLAKRKIAKNDKTLFEPKYIEEMDSRGY